MRRGPIVYCLESVDLPLGVELADVTISPDMHVETQYEASLLGGVTTLKARARAREGRGWDNSLYREITPAKARTIDIRMIPYYAWGNRGDSQMSVWAPRASAEPGDPVFVLDAKAFEHHVEFFNDMEPENIVNYVPNRQSWAWMRDNIPLFECPDKGFEQVYYYRWWTFRKHLKQTPDGFVFTEFLDKVGHSGKHNTISCALGHHIAEGSWLRDPRYIDEYARFWYLGHEGGMQPHFHAYSNWATAALYRRYLVNRDRAFLTSLLDAFLADYQGWVQERGVETGLFWQYDVRDGMEESISGGRKVRNLRPPLNSYLYANAAAISKVAELAGRDEIAGEYAEKAAKLKSLIHGLLWDDEAEFFKVRRPDGDAGRCPGGDRIHSLVLRPARAGIRAGMAATSRSAGIQGPDGHHDRGAQAPSVPQPRRGDVRVGRSRLALRDEPDARGPGQRAPRLPAILCEQGGLLRGSSDVRPSPSASWQAVHRGVPR